MTGAGSRRKGSRVRSPRHRAFAPAVAAAIGLAIIGAADDGSSPAAGRSSPPAAGRASPPASAPAPPSAKGPSPSMQRLIEALAGTWAVSETDEPDPGSPARAANPGTETWTPLTGGTTLLEENETTFPAGVDHGTALLWWDRRDGTVRGVWCFDASERGCEPLTARWDDATLAMSGEWTERGKPTAWRETYEFDGRDAFTQTLFFGPPGGTLRRAAIIRARRAAPGLHAARLSPGSHRTDPRPGTGAPVVRHP